MTGTQRYDENWIFFTEGYENKALRISHDKVVKFFEHVWWSGIDYPSFPVIYEGDIAYLVPQDICDRVVPIFREKYPYLSQVCDIMELPGQTVIRNVA